MKFQYVQLNHILKINLYHNQFQLIYILKFSEGSRGNIKLNISPKRTFEFPKYKLSEKPDENKLNFQ